MSTSNQPRERAIKRLTAILLERGSPRLQMLLFLTVTAVTGFLASALLHALGLRSMGIRYPLAVLIAYVSFLLLLMLLVHYHRSRRRHAPSTGTPTQEDILVMDASVPPDPFPIVPSASPLPVKAQVPPIAKAGAQPAAGDKKGGWDLDLGGGDGEGALVIVVILLIALAIGAALFASAIVLIEAPILLAELLVDGVLMVGLARRMRPRQEPDWTAGVISRTILPLVIVTTCVAGVGFALQYLIPDATTMGEALRLARSR